MACDREQGTHYQCDCMRERMVKLEEALRFYAERKNYFRNIEQGVGVKMTLWGSVQPREKRYSSRVELDSGEVARAALSSFASEAPEKEGEDGY